MDDYLIVTKGSASSRALFQRGTVVELKKSIQQTIQLGLPLLINDLFRYLLYFIDTAMVGHLSSHAMTVAGLAGLSNGIMINILFGLSAGVQGVLTRAISRGKTAKEIENLFAQFLVIGLAFGALFFAVYHFSVPALLKFAAINIPEGAEGFRQESIAYSRVLNFSTVVMAVFFVVHGYLAACRQTKWLALSGIAMGTLNVIFNYIFIFRLNWGVVGAAHGTLLAQTVVLSAILALTFPKWCKLKRWSRADIEQMLKFASWPGFQAALGLVSFFGFQSFCGWNGKEALAATIAALTTYRIMKVLVAGFANAGSIHLGHEIGIAPLSRARAILASSFVLALALVAIVGLGVLGLEPWIAPLFGAEVASSPIVHQALWFFAPIMALDALTVSLSIPLSKNGAGRRLFFSELATHALFTLLVGYSLWRYSSLGIYAIWMGFGLQVFANFIVVQDYARRGTWMKG